MAATIAVRSTSADVRDVASRSAGVQPPPVDQGVNQELELFADKAVATVPKPAHPLFISKFPLLRITNGCIRSGGFP